jgi:DNA sulfur modification protein DndD
MILDTLIIENFGAYGGIQQAELTPEPGRPVILFGGMNGGGKTTMLDAIQLVFYGARARISNRGKQPYKEYLRDSIHRGADLSEGASITLRFRRMMDGESHSFELCRSWRVGIKGVEETVRVRRDGLPDEMFTEHWDEVIDAYLPSGIAHLFFFDGEQIMELAEGGHAAEILGTAIHSLLGLDLVDRLESDLKVLERRKRSEGLGDEAVAELAIVRSELAQVDGEQEKAANDEGRLVNEAGRLAKEVTAAEDTFRAEGGDLYIQRNALEANLVMLKAKRSAAEASLRELVAGPLPLLLVEPQLEEVEQQVQHEREIRHAKTLVEALDERDQQVLSTLRDGGFPTASLKAIQQALAHDRNRRAGLASEPLLLDAPDGLAPHLRHLRAVVLPSAETLARKLVSELDAINEHVARVESDLERVPAADRIDAIQSALSAARAAHAEKASELQLLKMSKVVLAKRRADLEARLDRIGENQFDQMVTVDDRERILKHSAKVRGTLETFRGQVIKRHTSNMELLMLESFQKLLRKTELVKALSIDSSTFEASLTGRDGKTLPFDRLSAGERQLLATSMLWGLARASGRPIPTIIDTPLGRLDSEHRSHLIERYFPNASHQVLLLSTDEEISNDYLEALRPAITRSYLLDHDETKGSTSIKEGYFA